MSDCAIDCITLPLRHPPFHGLQTLAGSNVDWNFVMPIPAPDGAPNVLLILIDAAGFGNPGTLGGRPARAV
jgi:arylsulfatase